MPLPLDCPLYEPPPDGDEPLDAIEKALVNLVIAIVAREIEEEQAEQQER